MEEVDTLKWANEGINWTKAYTIEYIIVSIHIFLSDAYLEQATRGNIGKIIHDISLRMWGMYLIYENDIVDIEELINEFKVFDILHIRSDVRDEIIDNLRDFNNNSIVV